MTTLIWIPNSGIFPGRSMVVNAESLNNTLSEFMHKNLQLLC